MYYTDDPLADFARKDADDAAWLQSLPKCAECGEPIQQDFCYEMEGKVICEQCLNENHRKMVDDFI